MAPRSKRPPPVRRAGDYTQTCEIDLVRNPCARHHPGGGKGSRRACSLVANRQYIPHGRGWVEKLIARGAGLFAHSDEKEATVLRHYLPPNFSARDRHVLVRS